MMIKDKKTPMENHAAPRPETASLDNLFRRIAAEHKIITHYVIVLQGMMAEKKNATRPMELETVLDLMKKEMANHFYIEEKLFFKIGLTHLPHEFHGLIAELTREHEELTDRLEGILETVQGGQPRDGVWTEGLKEALEGFLVKVKSHARKELSELFPVLESDEGARARLLMSVQDIVSN